MNKKNCGLSRPVATRNFLRLIENQCLCCRQSMGLFGCQRTLRPQNVFTRRSCHGFFLCRLYGWCVQIPTVPAKNNRAFRRRRFVGDSKCHSPGIPVTPVSLDLAQLRERLGAQALAKHRLLEFLRAPRERLSLKPPSPWRKIAFVRAHGMWTYEPRQGRKAATVVCSVSAVVTLTFFYL
jgi:hypothetical protein